MSLFNLINMKSWVNDKKDKSVSYDTDSSFLSIPNIILPYMDFLFHHF